WTVVSAITWWTFAFTRRCAHVAYHNPRGTKPMTFDAARIACGTGLLPLLVGLFFATAVLFEAIIKPSNSETATFAASEVSGIVAIVVWLLLWRKQVTWTPTRRKLTTVLIMLLLVVPAAAFISDSSGSANPLEAIAGVVRNTLSLFVLAL